MLLGDGRGNHGEIDYSNQYASCRTQQQLLHVNKLELSGGGGVGWTEGWRTLQYSGEHLDRRTSVYVGLTSTTD